MVGVVPAEHLAPHRLTRGLEVLHRQLPSGLHGLAAARGEEHPVEVTGRQCGESLGQADARLVAEAPQREVAERRGLLSRCLGEFTPAVPDLHGEQPGQSIEQAVAVLVEDVVALATHDHRHRLALERVHLREVTPQMPAGGSLEVRLAQWAPHA